MVELLLAVLILVISMVGVALVFGRGTAMMTGEIKEEVIATQAAQERLETIRNLPFDTLLSLGSTFTAVGLSNLNNAIGTVAVTDPLGSNDIRQVTVTVTWQSSEGRTHQKSLVTLVTRNGINRQ